MEVVFKKDKTKDYVCDNCSKQFNWNNESRYWGKMEYKTIQEEKERKFFCSEQCAKKYFLNEYKNL